MKNLLFIILTFVSISCDSSKQEMKNSTKETSSISSNTIDNKVLIQVKTDTMAKKVDLEEKRPIYPVFFTHETFDTVVEEKLEKLFEEEVLQLKEDYENKVKKIEVNRKDLIDSLFSWKEFSVFDTSFKYYGLTNGPDNNFKWHLANLSISAEVVEGDGSCEASLFFMLSIQANNIDEEVILFTGIPKASFEDGTFEESDNNLITIFSEKPWDSSNVKDAELDTTFYSLRNDHIKMFRIYEAGFSNNYHPTYYCASGQIMISTSDSSFIKFPQYHAQHMSEDVYMNAKVDPVLLIESLMGSDISVLVSNNQFGKTITKFNYASGDTIETTYLYGPNEPCF